MTLSISEAKTLLRSAFIDLELTAVQANRIADLLDSATVEPADPMDWPLPCDVTVGHGTMQKGVKLRTLVTRMKALYEMATGQNADEVAGRSLEQREALFAAAGASPQPDDYDTWAKNPYTLVLQKSIEQDYVPRLQPSQAGEPVAYQSRMRPLWGQSLWTEWSNCTKGMHDDYKKTPILNDWEFEARALSVTPQGAQQPSQADAQDAERYRWLRSTTNWASNSNNERIDVRNSPELWDAAIDAAMTAKNAITQCIQATVVAP